jgi:hypothetical protein
MSLVQNGFVPVFVIGKNQTSEIPYPTIRVDVEDKYRFLYKKMFLTFIEVLRLYPDLDFICKIDDDTLINFDRFNDSMLQNMDYIGRMSHGKSSMKIILDLDLFDIHTTFNMNQQFLNEEFTFATGNCYFLSKKALQFIVNSKLMIFDDSLRIPEDKLFGYMLKDKPIVLNNINYSNKTIEENRLQVTQNFFSIHPIHENLFDNLLNLKVEEQINFLHNNKILNFTRRMVYTKGLEDNLKNVITEFIDSKKTIGLG